MDTQESVQTETPDATQDALQAWANAGKEPENMGEVEVPQAPEVEEDEEETPPEVAPDSEELAASEEEVEPLSDRLQHVYDYLRAEDREIIDSLEPEQKAQFLEGQAERNKSIERKLANLGVEAKDLEAYNEMFSGLDPQLSQQGLTRNQYVANLLSFDDAYRADPEQVVRQLAEQAGLKIAENDEEGFTDPLESKLSAKIEQLESKLAAYENKAQQSNVSEVNQVIDTVRNEADSEGNLIRPDFDRLEEYITAKAGVLRASHPEMSVKDILVKAYDAVAKDFGPATQPPIEKPEGKPKVSVKDKKKAASSLKGASKDAVTSTPKSGRDQLAEDFHKFFPDGKVKF